VRWFVLPEYHRGPGARRPGLGRAVGRALCGHPSSQRGGVRQHRLCAVAELARVQPGELNSCEFSYSSAATHSSARRISRRKALVLPRGATPAAAGHFLSALLFGKPPVAIDRETVPLLLLPSRPTDADALDLLRPPEAEQMAPITRRGVTAPAVAK